MVSAIASFSLLFIRMMPIHTSITSKFAYITIYNTFLLIAKPIIYFLISLYKDAL